MPKRLGVLSLGIVARKFCFGCAAGDKRLQWLSSRLRFVVCRPFMPCFLPCGSIARPWRRILCRAIYGRALAFQNKSRFELWKLNCEHSVVELKAADRRAIRSDSMERKSPAREVLGFLSQPHHLRSHQRSRQMTVKNEIKFCPKFPSLWITLGHRA